MIKLKHIKLEKPDKREHYPSKGEGTPATAQSKERVKGPPHPKPKQDDANRNYWYLQIKMYNGKKSGLPDTKTKNKTWERLGTYPPTNAVTQNLSGLKVRKIQHQEMNIHVL